MITIPEGASPEVVAECEELIEMELALRDKLGYDRFNELVDGGVWALIEGSPIERREPVDEKDAFFKAQLIDMLMGLDRPIVVRLLTHWDVR